MKTPTPWLPCLLVLLAAATTPSDAPASGYYGPRVYLGEGGRLLDATPEFYWELEVKRLSREFTPPEKRVLAPPVKREPAADGERGEWIDAYAIFTAEKDVADFADALRKGAVKTADPAGAARLHAAARESLTANKANSGLLPDEAPSEFADFHRGAQAYRERRFEAATRPDRTTSAARPAPFARCP